MKGWPNEPYRHSLSSYGIKTSKGKQRWDESNFTKNLEMDDEVYQLRREVMNIIYDAKDMVDDDLPRITVRVVKPKPEHKGTLGVAEIGEDDIIWINKKVIEKDYPLRQIVYHEILHSVYDVDHDSDDLLMHPTQTFPSLTQEEVDHLFMKHIEGSDKE